MSSCRIVARRTAGYVQLAVLVAGLSATAALASDHLDSPQVIADPRADIGDVYAWMSPDARRLNLVMTIVGHSFSDRLDYIFHIDSGRHFGETRQSIELSCRFADATAATCRLGTIDRVQGNAGEPSGIASVRGRFRLFAGRRDDPFFNNVRGTRDAYQAATRSLAAGARYDAAGCPQFTQKQSADILARWAQSDGAPGKNFLAGWTPSVIVASVDVSAVRLGGPMLAVWGSTASAKEQIDRAARPLTGNALLATLGKEEERTALKLSYNRSAPSDAEAFVKPIAKGVALYDGFDGRCGDAMLIDRKAPPEKRYWRMARLLADDRLWVNSRSGRCTELLAVERAALNGETRLAMDCGGRTTGYDSVNAYRSLIVNGTPRSMDDGVHVDDRVHSPSIFPFLAEPAREGASR